MTFYRNTFCIGTAFGGMISANKFTSENVKAPTRFTFHKFASRIMRKMKRMEMPPQSKARRTRNSRFQVRRLNCLVWLPISTFWTDCGTRQFFPPTYWFGILNPEGPISPVFGCDRKVLKIACTCSQDPNRSSRLRLRQRRPRTSFFSSF